MGERTRYSIVKGIAAEEARGAIDEALTALPGPRPLTLSEATWQPIRSTRELTAVCAGGALVMHDDAWLLAEQIAVRHGLLHLELRAQEGDHWDFSLFRGRELIADFNTRVGYFESDPRVPRPWKRGTTETFAAAWNVPAGAIAPYLVDWDALQEPRRATPTSRSGSGDWCEIFDFMAAIGVPSPDAHPDSFSVRMPVWRMMPRERT